MIFTSFTSLALLSGMVLFSSAAPWHRDYSATEVTHIVNVSNDTAGLIFDPSYITAKAGERVSFVFHQKNHTVTQSSFDAPCTPLVGGIDTGFNNPVAPGSSLLPVVDFIVDNTKPIWIHCRQAANTAASHCGQGMVFAVNPGPYGSNNSFDEFKAKALAIGKQLASISTASNGTASNSTKY